MQGVVGFSLPGTNVHCVVVSFPGTKVHGNETSIISGLL